MSVYPPPIENVPIFNPFNYVGSGAGNASLDYPIAQGLEIFPDGVQFGDGTIQTSASNSQVIGNGACFTYNFYTEKNSSSATGSNMNVFKIVLTGGTPSAQQFKPSDLIYLKVVMTGMIYISGSGWNNQMIFDGVWILKPYALCYLASGTITNATGSSGSPMNGSGVGYSGNILNPFSANVGQYWASYSSINSGWGSGSNNGVSCLISNQGIDGNGSYNCSMMMQINTGNQDAGGNTRFQNCSATVQVMYCPPLRDATYPSLQIQGFSGTGNTSTNTSNVSYANI